MHDRSTQARATLVDHELDVETERLIQRGRVAALVLALGLAISFGSDRSVGVTAAVVLLAACVLATHLVLRRARDLRTIAVLGWASFAADAAVCGLALSAVADDPVDPIVMITVMVAIEAAVRWGPAGAVGGGLLAGALAVAWAASGYEATGRELPATSIAFRGLSPVVISLPVGLLIERLRRQREHTRRLFEHASDPTLIVSGGRVVAANPAAAHLAGVPVEQLRGEPFDARFGALLEVSALETLLTLPADGRSPVPITDEHGEQRWYAVAAEATDDTDLVFVTARDVTEDRVREQELRFRAWHDPLTGLPNRAVLQSRLDGWLGEDGALGVVFLDLDGFKEINDLHGHTAGDDLLVEVADRLRQVTRDADAVHRWAGDEFCLAVPGADQTVLDALAERIDATLRHPYRVGSSTVHVGASVGTALARPGDTEASLIQRADEQMYRRKRPELASPDGTERA